MPPTSHPVRRRSVVRSGPQIATAKGTSGILVNGLINAPRADEIMKSPIASSSFFVTNRLKKSTIRQNSFCSNAEDQNNNAMMIARTSPMITRLFIWLSIANVLPARRVDLLQNNGR